MNTHAKVSAPARRMAGPSGFTLLDLCATLVVVSALFSLLAPGLARTRSGAATLVCLNHQKQLLLAWQMYHEENRGAVPMNLFGSPSLTDRLAPWAMGVLDWSNRPDNTNTLPLLDDQMSRLAVYLQYRPAVYRCPADSFLSADQARQGWTHRVRSYAMNFAFGSDVTSLPRWERTVYRQVRKVWDMKYPSFAESFVFVEEHPDTMDDAGFLPPITGGWGNVPATHHDGGATFAFADGHAELTKWHGSLATDRPRKVVAKPVSEENPALTFMTAPVGDPDVHWISYRTPRITPKSF